MYVVIFYLSSSKKTGLFVGDFDLSNNTILVDQYFKMKGEWKGDAFDFFHDLGPSRFKLMPIDTLSPKSSIKVAALESRSPSSITSSPTKQQSGSVFIDQSMRHQSMRRQSVRPRKLAKRKAESDSELPLILVSNDFVDINQAPIKKKNKQIDLSASSGVENVLSSNCQQYFNLYVNRDILARPSSMLCDIWRNFDDGSLFTDIHFMSERRLSLPTNQKWLESIAVRVFDIDLKEYPVKTELIKQIFVCARQRFCMPANEQLLTMSFDELYDVYMTSGAYTAFIVEDITESLELYCSIVSYLFFMGDRSPILLKLLMSDNHAAKIPNSLGSIVPSDISQVQYPLGWLYRDLHKKYPLSSQWINIEQRRIFPWVMPNSNLEVPDSCVIEELMKKSVYQRCKEEMDADVTAFAPILLTAPASSVVRGPQQQAATMVVVADPPTSPTTAVGSSVSETELLKEVSEVVKEGVVEDEHNSEPVNVQVSLSSVTPTPAVVSSISETELLKEGPQQQMKIVETVSTSSLVDRCATHVSGAVAVKFRARKSKVTDVVATPLSQLSVTSTTTVVEQQQQAATLVLHETDSEVAVNVPVSQPSVTSTAVVGEQQEQQVEIVTVVDSPAFSAAAELKKVTEGVQEVAVEEKPEMDVDAPLSDLSVDGPQQHAKTVKAVVESSVVSSAAAEELMKVPEVMAVNGPVSQLSVTSTAVVGEQQDQQVEIVAVEKVPAAILVARPATHVDEDDVMFRASKSKVTNEAVVPKLRLSVAPLASAAVGSLVSEVAAFEQVTEVVHEAAVEEKPEMDVDAPLSDLSVDGPQQHAETVKAVVESSVVSPTAAEELMKVPEVMDVAGPVSQLSVTFALLDHHNHLSTTPDNVSPDDEDDEMDLDDAVRSTTNVETFENIGILEESMVEGGEKEDDVQPRLKEMAEDVEFLQKRNPAYRLEFSSSLPSMSEFHDDLETMHEESCEKFLSDRFSVGLPEDSPNYFINEPSPDEDGVTEIPSLGLLQIDNHHGCQRTQDGSKIEFLVTTETLPIKLGVYSGGHSQGFYIGGRKPPDDSCSWPLTCATDLSVQRKKGFAACFYLCHQKQKNVPNFALHLNQADESFNKGDKLCFQRMGEATFCELNRGEQFVLSGGDRFWVDTDSDGERREVYTYRPADSDTPLPSRKRFYSATILEKMLQSTVVSTSSSVDSSTPEQVDRKKSNRSAEKNSPPTRERVVRAPDQIDRIAALREAFPKKRIAADFGNGQAIFNEHYQNFGEERLFDLKKNAPQSLQYKWITVHDIRTRADFESDAAWETSDDLFYQRCFEALHKENPNIMWALCLVSGDGNCYYHSAVVNALVTDPDVANQPYYHHLRQIVCDKVEDHVEDDQICAVNGGISPLDFFARGHSDGLAVLDTTGNNLPQDTDDITPEELDAKTDMYLKKVAANWEKVNRAFWAEQKRTRKLGKMNTIMTMLGYALLKAGRRISIYNYNQKYDVVVRNDEYLVGKEVDPNREIRFFRQDEHFIACAKMEDVGKFMAPAARPKNTATHDDRGNPRAAANTPTANKQVGGAAKKKGPSKLGTKKKNQSPAGRATTRKGKKSPPSVSFNKPPEVQQRRRIVFDNYDADKHVWREESTDESLSEEEEEDEWDE
jgi:hypothetical protein